MNQPKIVVHSVIVKVPDIEEEILKAVGANVVFVPNDEVERFFLETKDADACLIADRQILPEHVEKMSKCKIIARQGTGFDNIDLVNTKSKGIVVTNVPDYCIPEVSDYTMALMFNLIRNVSTYNRHVRSGVWDIQSTTSLEGLPPMRRLSTQTLGIVGFGKIAREVARKATPFGFRIITSDPYITKEVTDDYGVDLVSLDQLLKESDIISLHTPLTPETRYMFNLDTFKKMKSNAVLINASRGSLINEKDLYTAVNEGIIAGAALDVTEVEPVERDNPLLTLNNVFITPHAAFFTEDSYNELRRRAAEEVIRVLNGKEPENRVNK